MHERCVTSVVTPCSGIAPCIIKNPVAHCWSEPTHHKRKFCTVCRKRLDETPAVHCMSKYIHPSLHYREALAFSPVWITDSTDHFTFFFFHCHTVCEYFAHVECQDFAVPDCKENATYVPGKDLSSFKHQVSVCARVCIDVWQNVDAFRTHDRHIGINDILTFPRRSIIGEKVIFHKHRNALIARKHAGLRNA